MTYQYDIPASSPSSQGNEAGGFGFSTEVEEKLHQLYGATLRLARYDLEAQLSQSRSLADTLEAAILDVRRRRRRRRRKRPTRDRAAKQEGRD